MSSFEIDWGGWEDSRVPVESHARTWARLEIHVGDVIATRVDDVAARSTRNAIRGPVMPLAEWLLGNFWYLVGEAPTRYPVRSPRESVERDWYRRHNLLFAREGFPLPDLTFAKGTDERVLVSLHRDPARTGYPVRFTEDCEVLVERADFEREIDKLISAVVERLDGCDARDAVELRAAWESYRGLRDEERLLCQRAAALGLDGLDEEAVPDSLADELVDGLAFLPDELASDLLEVGRPPEASLDWLRAARAGSSLDTAHADVVTARAAVAPALRDVATAHATGWRLARAARAAVLGIPGAALPAVIDRAVGEWVVPRAIGGPKPVGALRGWVGIDGRFVAVLGAARDEPTQRWLNARSLCLGLLGGRERLVTNAQSWSQSVSRSFATELVAPWERIAERVATDAVTDDEVGAIAAELRAPLRTVQHQLENHGVMITD